MEAISFKGARLVIDVRLSSLRPLSSKGRRAYPNLSYPTRNMDSLETHTEFESDLVLCHDICSSESLLSEAF